MQEQMTYSNQLTLATNMKACCDGALYSAHLEAICNNTTLIHFSNVTFNKTGLLVHILECSSLLTVFCTRQWIFKDEIISYRARGYHPANAQHCGNIVTTLSLVRLDTTLLQC